MILNLKTLNKDVEYHHFKMETLRNALDLVRKNCFFCSLDLKDAYFSVHVTEASQEFLKFSWRSQLYAFTAFPNGLACCPRLFTKLLKPVMAHLHMLGFVSTIFIDDTLLMGDSEEECVQNVKQSLALFQKLGFVVHPEKSVLVPSHKITYLGFVIDSQCMTVTPTLINNNNNYCICKAQTLDKVNSKRTANQSKTHTHTHTHLKTRTHTRHEAYSGGSGR